MASYRLADILKSRSEFSDAEIERMDEDEAWQWIRENPAGVAQTDEASSGCQT